MLDQALALQCWHESLPVHKKLFSTRKLINIPPLRGVFSKFRCHSGLIITFHRMSSIIDSTSRAGGVEKKTNNKHT